MNWTPIVRINGQIVTVSFVVNVVTKEWRVNWIQNEGFWRIFWVFFFVFRIHFWYFYLLWMNEFLEQLVRGLTNAYSRSQKCLVSVYHLAPQISEAFSVFLVAEGNCYKSDNSWSIWTVYALSLSLSAYFLRTRFMMSFAKDKGLFLNAAALKPVSKQRHLRQNFWAQIIFDPYRRPLTLTFLHVSIRGLFQDTMFDRLQKQHVIRGCFRSSSATVSLRHREGNLFGSCGRKTHPETV